MDCAFTERFDHAPACDHMAAITGLASCTRLKLVTSCSLDGTVRVWDCNNKLLRYALLGMELFPLVWHNNHNYSSHAHTVFSLLFCLPSFCAGQGAVVVV